MLHYHHRFIQVFNELSLGKGFLVGFQPLSIDKHGMASSSMVLIRTEPLSLHFSIV